MKASLGIPSGTTSEDAYIEDAIDAAEDEINNFCGRTFVADTSATARVYLPSSNVLVYTDDFHTKDSLVVKQDDSNNGTYGTTLTITEDFIVVGNSAPSVTGELVLHSGRLRRNKRRHSDTVRNVVWADCGF